jgi:hypothetical protein
MVYGVKHNKASPSSYVSIIALDIQSHKIQILGFNLVHSITDHMMFEEANICIYKQDVWSSDQSCSAVLGNAHRSSVDDFNIQFPTVVFYDLSSAVGTTISNDDPGIAYVLFSQ